MSKLLRTGATTGAIVLVIWTAGAIGLRFAGGASDHEPWAMAESLSPGARRLLDAAFEDVSPDDLVDHHVHVLGLGTNGIGTWVHSKMLSWSQPLSRIKALAYLSGARVSDPTHADEQYVARLVDLARNAGAGRLLLLGFDYRYDEEGKRSLERSEFHTPNRYVTDLARAHPDLFVIIGEPTGQ